MRRSLWAIVALMVLPSIAGAETIAPLYPPDVQKFTERVAMCAEALKDHLVLPHEYWACDKLATDRAILTGRYRREPKLIDALNWHWVLEVRRVQVKIQSP
jgi:predicted small lipoprotein YifL